MCIVCGPGGTHFLQTLVERYGGGVPARARFVAEEVEPETVPPLDPDDHADLAGPADVILRGGPILTMRRPGEAVAALALRAGRIQRLGDVADVLALRSRLTRVIDLDGRAVTPGFVNAHWHPPLSLLCDWLPANDSGALAELRRAGAADPGEWLVAQTESAPPELVKTLDAIMARPALLVDASGNVLHANAAAAGLPRADEALRAAEGRHPHVSSLLPLFAQRMAASREPMQRRLRRTFGALARGGFTCLRYCGLGGLGGAEDIIMARAALNGQNLLRLRAALDMRLMDGLHRTPGFGDDMFRVDAAAAWIGPTPEAAGKLARHAAELRGQGWRVTWHTQGAAIDGVPAPGADSFECRPGDVAQLAGQAALGSLSVGLTLADPPERAAAAALRCLEASGALVSISLDRVAGAAAPFEVLAHAEGRLDLLTSLAARRCGAGVILGTLDTGRYADLAFLDADPRGRPASGVRCLATWIAGRETRPEAAGALL